MRAETSLRGGVGDREARPDGGTPSRRRLELEVPGERGDPV